MTENKQPDGKPETGTPTTDNSAAPTQPAKSSVKPSDLKSAANTSSEASKSATDGDTSTTAKNGSNSASDDKSFTDRVKDAADTATEKVKTAANKAADKVEDFGDDISSGNQPAKSHFGNGMFVIALIVFALIVLALTWSVSFTSMLFGAIGALLSIALCVFVNHDNFNFEAHCDCKPNEENLVYLAVRAVVGMISGAAVTAIVFVSIVPNWHLIAVVALFAGLIVDRLLFPRLRKDK